MLRSERIPGRYEILGDKMTSSAILQKLWESEGKGSGFF
jgi:hypothetical protein